MREENQWELARARFDALRRNKPSWIKRPEVDEYHLILRVLEAASGVDLSAFRIPDSELKPRVSGISLATRRRPGATRYSDERYCDDGFFSRRIDGLWNYLRTLDISNQKESRMGEPADYWAMSNDELEQLARQHNVFPYPRTGPQGETFYVDRDSDYRRTRKA